MEIKEHPDEKWIKKKFESRSGCWGVDYNNRASIDYIYKENKIKILYIKWLKRRQ